MLKARWFTIANGRPVISAFAGNVHFWTLYFWPYLVLSWPSPLTLWTQSLISTHICPNYTKVAATIEWIFYQLCLDVGSALFSKVTLFSLSEVLCGVKNVDPGAQVLRRRLFWQKSAPSQLLHHSPIVAMRLWSCKIGKIATNIMWDIVLTNVQYTIMQAISFSPWW